MKITDDPKPIDQMTPDEIIDAEKLVGELDLRYDTDLMLFETERDYGTK